MTTRLRPLAIATVVSLLAALAVTAAPPLAGPADAALGDLIFTPISTHVAGDDEGFSEIADYNPSNQYVYYTNAEDNTIEILDLSNPASPAEVGSTSLEEYGGGVNSVAVAPDGSYVAAAVEADPATDPGAVVFLQPDGTALGAVEAGNLPDMVTFTPDGDYVLTANEGEPNDDYSIDPEGSVTIIDVSGGIDDLEALPVATATFPAEAPEGVRSSGPEGTTFPQDAEPEYIGVSPDSSTAYVSLQENNAIAVVDIASASVSDVFGLGFKDYSEGPTIDPSNEDGGPNFANWPVFGTYMPDAVDTFEVGGTTYIATANEGDARVRPDGGDNEGEVYADEARIADVTLDPALFPNAEELQEEPNLGRLHIITDLGDTDDDGDYDELYSFGGRSFSIYNGDGEQVFDAGDEIERLVASETPALFPDNRSDDKGTEPEAVEYGAIDDTPYVFVGLERSSGIVAYDVSTPSDAELVGYAYPGAPVFNQAPGTTDVSPEGLKFISAEDSPSGRPLLVVTNEVSSTVTTYELRRGDVGQGEDPAGISRASGEDSIGTAVAMSERYYPGGAGTVVIARADDYADALAAGPLSAANGWPLLFVNTESTPAQVLDEVERLGAQNAVIVGGTAAVSAEAEQELEDAGVATRRLAGDNRFDTALAIAAELLGDATPDTVFFVEGENADPTRGWPDAISASALAGALGQPILPVNAEFVPPQIQAQWDEWAEAEGIIIGGEVAVQPDVEASLTGAPAFAGDDEGRSLMRLAGPTRDATSTEVFEYGVSEAGLDPTTTFLIPGGNFNEGLVAGAIGGRDSRPTLMVDSADLANTVVAQTALTETAQLIRNPVMVGATEVIPTSVAEQIVDARAPQNVQAAFCLTLLHNNDAESQLFNAPSSEDYGGLARFVSLAKAEQAATAPGGCANSGTVTVTSGDNFLAGPEFEASRQLPPGEPFYGPRGFDLVGYDALDIGNHEFDFGPDTLERFITSFSEPRPPFLSANLDFSGEPGLQALVDAGDIAPRTVVTKNGVDIGIIGLSPPNLDSISSPRGVEIDTNVIGVVNEQVAALEADGVDHIILISHLQGIDADIELIENISGVDAVVAGGGDEVLASPGDPLVPGDLMSTFDTYPLEVSDSDGETVPVVTTAGDLKYLGRLNLYFDQDGELLVDTPYDPTTSRMLRVADGTIFDGVPGNEFVTEEVLPPVAEFVVGLEENVIATSEVGLDGSRPNIRQQETNLGNLVADSFIYSATTRAEDFGLDPTADFVALANGGGIRNNSVIPAGDITELTTFDILPFSNFVGAIPDVSPAQLQSVLERAYSAVENAGGNFGHLSGITVEADLSQPAQEIDDDDNITSEGSRVRTATLEDGTEIIVDGEVVPGAPDVTLVTVDFLARGGDSYPLGDLPFSILGLSYQASLAEYLVDGIGGTVTAADYPEGGEGRITFTGLE